MSAQSAATESRARASSSESYSGSYVAYGLGIRASIALPELLARPCEANLDVRLGDVCAPRAPVPRTGEYFSVEPEGVYLHWPDVGSFLVREGREIVVDPAPSVRAQVVRLFLLGPALAVLLDQRGLQVLHASAVELDGSAVAFVGASGSGKSTIAAALYARGHTVVADDLVPVRDVGRFETLPGFPHLKLTDDTVATLQSRSERARPGARVSGKLVSAAWRGFATDPLPLERIYLLDWGERAAIEPVAPQDAILALLRNSWCGRLRRTAGAGPALQRCGSLAERVPVRRLTGPRALDRLPDLVRLVEQDLER
jgi:hypothetical protein